MKKNDYIVIRRIEMTDNEESWEEFENNVRGFLNMGYELVGGISVNIGRGCSISVAQALIKNRKVANV